MTDVPTVSYLALLLASVSSMVIGFLWYSPQFFGKQWMKLVDMTDKKMASAKDKMPLIFGTSFVLGFIQAFTLSHVYSFASAYYRDSGVARGLQTGFWAWFGFIATVMLINIMYQKRPLKLFAIDAGYQLVVMLVMGSIIGYMT